MLCCRNCRHWDQRYPQNQLLGVCTIMGAFIYPKEKLDAPAFEGDVLPFDVAISVQPSRDSYNPLITDVLAVRTTAKFGCIHHESKPTTADPTPESV